MANMDFLNHFRHSRLQAYSKLTEGLRKSRLVSFSETLRSHGWRSRAYKDVFTACFRKAHQPTPLHQNSKPKKTGAQRPPFSIQPVKTDHQPPDSDCSEGSSSIC